MSMLRDVGVHSIYKLAVPFPSREKVYERWFTAN